MTKFVYVCDVCGKETKSVENIVSLNVSCDSDSTGAIASKIVRRIELCKDCYKGSVVESAIKRLGASK